MVSKLEYPESKTLYSPGNTQRNNEFAIKKTAMTI
jgi:hypothetical protein